MKRKRLIIISFLLLAITQILVSGYTLIDHEITLSKGKSFRFKTAPVDPYDPLRGKYVRLSHSNLTFSDSLATDTNWRYKEGYVCFDIDSTGLAYVSHLDSVPPKHTVYYLKTTYTQEGPEIWVDIPHTRFYMEESKAFKAEMAYRKSARSANSLTYSEIVIYKGKSVLTNVFIDDIPIAEYAEENE